MRILHVVHGYPPSVGGSQLLVQHLSEQLVTRYGDRVTVFTTTARNVEMFWNPREPALPAGTEVINGVTVRRFPVFNRLNTLRRRQWDTDCISPTTTGSALSSRVLWSLE